MPKTEHPNSAEEANPLLTNGAPGIILQQRPRPSGRLAQVLYVGLPTLISVVLLAVISGCIILFASLRDEVCANTLMVGYDFSGGFVPQGVNSKPSLLATSSSRYEIASDVFESTSVLNDTIMAWNELAPGASFVSTEATPWYGSEEPLETPGHGGVFQIAALHQMHCLTTILRDYSLLLMGFGVDEIYDNRPIEKIRSHSAHCFNEIRRALTCLADGTALGHGEDPLKVDAEGKLHVCNDYSALLEWATDPVRKMPDDTRGGY